MQTEQKACSNTDKSKYAKAPAQTHRGRDIAHTHARTHTRKETIARQNQTHALTTHTRTHARTHAKK